MAISRFSYASMRVMELEAAIKHYTEVVGLRLVESDDQSAYFQADECQDHHCVIVNLSDRAGIDHVGFKVNDPSDLVEAAEAAAAWGLAVRDVPQGEIAGQGPGVMITLPSSHNMLLFYHADKIGYANGMLNPSPGVSKNKVGAKVTHLDHTLLSCENAQPTVDFLTEVLDFSLTEKVVDPAGNIIAAFMSCTNTMHDLALGPGPDGTFHHMAFGMHSRSEVLEGVDILKEDEVPALEYGVSRHGIAGVTTIYFHDPSGNRNEFFNGAYQAAGRPGLVPPVIWDVDNFPRGAFYYESSVPEAFFDQVT